MDLPFPRDRWIEDSSAPFDAEGGMIDFWVTPTEFEQILLDFETAGWDLGDREETPGRINVIGYADDQTRAVNIVFVEETKDRDSRLTVTYVASV